MGRITVTTEPIELDINGVLVTMEGDPSAGEDFAALMDLPIQWGSQKERDATTAGLIERLSAMALSEADIAALKTIPPATLKRAAEAYVQAVTGFPTQPSKSSGRR